MREEVAEGEGMQADDEDHAAHAEDVERPVLETEKADQQRVEVPRVGAHKDDVGERCEVGRQHIGERHQGLDDAAQRHIGPGRGPGHRDTQHDADDAGAERQDEGIDQWIEVLRRADRRG